MNRSPFSGWKPLLLGIALTLLLGGCRALDSKLTGTWWPVPERMAKLERQEARGNDDTIDNVAGPTERRLKAKEWGANRERLSVEGTRQEKEQLSQYKQGEELFAQKKFSEAETVFKQISKSRRRTYESSYDRVLHFWGVGGLNYDPYKQFGDPLEEDAVFMTAECQFAQKKYAKAQDTYDELLSRYPSTMHLDRVTRQLFRVARYWLDFDESVESSGDVQQTAGEEQKKKLLAHRKAESDKTFLVPNLTDGTRPLFDTKGRALQALKSIWLHDATGPLADDALMLSAAYRLRSGDNQEASRLYKLLREQYPDSPHLENAYILGSHVTMASYQGPKYDGVVLAEASNLKKQTLRGFGDRLDPEEKERLEKELKRMHEAEVARMWEKVQYYRTKHQTKSVELYCHLLINKYPQSKYAERCQKLLDVGESAEITDAGRKSWLGIGGSGFVRDDLTDQKLQGKKNVEPSVEQSARPAPIDSSLEFGER